MRTWEKPPYYMTAYGLAVKHGFKGTEEEWLESLAGLPGEFAEVSEAWAVGKRDGKDVESTDPAYHNNSKYYSEQAAESADEADRIVSGAISDITSAKNQSVSAVQGEGTTQVTAVQAAGTTAASAVQTEGTTQVSAVQTAGTAAVTEVQTEGATQIAAATAQAQAASGSASDANTAKLAAQAAQAEVEQYTASVIDTWLAAHIDPETGYALDRSLTSKNSAAPADIVGDLKGLSESKEEAIHLGYDNLFYKDDVLEGQGRVLSDTGGFNGDANFNHVAIPVSGGDILHFKTNATSGGHSGTIYLGYAIYDSNDQYITGQETNGAGTYDVTMPTGAATFRIGSHKDYWDADSSVFKLNYANTNYARYVKANAYTNRGYYNSDLNSCVDAGTYYLGPSCTNYPAGISGVQNYTLLVFNKSALEGDYNHQFLLDNENNAWHRLIRNNGTVALNWTKVVDYSFYKIANGITTAPYYCYQFNKVLKWFNNLNNSITILTNPVSYIRYADYDTVSTGTVLAVYGMLCQCTETIFKADKNYAANESIDLEGCVLIDCPKRQTYRIHILPANSGNWAPTNPQITKEIILDKGKHIVSLEGCKVTTAISAGVVLSCVAIETGSIDTDTDDFCFGVVKIDYASMSQTKIEDLFPELFGGYDIIFWGDSLTAGAGGDGTTYCKVCADLLGKNFKNCGVGGETENTIAARQGGNNLIIPSGSVNGDYTLAQMLDAYGKPIHPLRQGNGSNTVNPVIINGQECTLTITQESGTDPDATYSISGYTGTIPFEVPALFGGYKEYGDITVIFVGTNGLLSGYSVENRISVIKSMLSRVGKKYVILGISMGTEAQRSADDAAMQEAFGNHFFPTRKMLVNYGLATMGITPTTQDNEDIASGIVPTSLRSDDLHLNADGYTALGKMLASFIVGLGYAEYAE